MKEIDTTKTMNTHAHRSIKKKAHRFLQKAYFVTGILLAMIVQLACNNDPDINVPIIEENTSNKKQPRFICEKNVEKKKLSKANRILENKLWSETLKYLEGFVEGLESTTKSCNSPSVITQTYSPKLKGIQRECLRNKKDIKQMIKHIKIVLKFPNKARVCFDAQKNYKEFPLYTPSENMKKQNKVASWINRSTLSDFYKKRTGKIGKAGRELSNAFRSILKKTKTPSAISKDITFNTLPTLWTSVGWLPFYADNKLALNDRFRGGYAYAEVMGPWGLLRIKSIDKEIVGSEVGMTIQLGDSYYPYHYHDPQEVYMNLTPTECVDENKFMVMNWDNGALKQKINKDGSVDVTVRAPKKRWQKWFTNHSSKKNWITYFNRHAIHSFYVNKKCFDPNDPSGLVTMWARTTSRKHNQSTRICKPSKQGKLPVGPGDLFTCSIDGIITD